MVGCGRSNIAEICDLARANVVDGLPSPAIRAFSSLGSGGLYEANQERDMHRWLHQIYGCKLSTFKVSMHLTVSWHVLFSKLVGCLFMFGNSLNQKPFSISLEIGVGSRKCFLIEGP